MDVIRSGPVSSVLVVVEPSEAERVARWLAELAVEVRLGDGSDDTLASFRRRPADAVVLAAGIDSGDALAFAHALRTEGGQAAPLVLIGDETGPVRNALDALDFGADAFLRRPLAKASLLYAVKSALHTGRSGLVSAVVDAQPGAAPSLDFQPVAPGAAGSLPGVAKHALSQKLEDATAEAVDAFLHDLLELTLSTDLVGEEVDDFAPEDPPSWREPTQILSGNPAVVAPPAQASHAGTYVSELRRHMEAVEARLFGDSEGSDAGDGEPPPDIDLDAIGVTTPGIAGDPLAEEQDAGVTSSGVVQRGDLADDDAAEIFGQLYRERFSGQVTFSRDGVEKVVYLEEGRPVFAASNQERDRMGELLYREGKITAERLAEARERVAHSGRRMGEILVELGHLKRRELLPAVRHHVEDIVYSVFSWDSGRFVVSTDEGAAGEKIRLHAHPSAVVMEGVRRKMDLERLHLRLGTRETVLAPGKIEEMLDALAEADLLPEERKIVELFDGRRSLAEVAVAARREGWGEESVYPLAYALLALGLARPIGRVDTDGGRSTTGVSPVTGAGDVAIDRERVLAKHAHVKEADYFAVLGVRRDATAFEVKRAYEAARRDYAPEVFPAEVAADLGAELGEIALVLDEAQKILRSDRLRASYLENLVD
jgi:DNA-binding response OmpR family regulator